MNPPDPQQYQRLREVFHAAREIPQIEQAEYLRAACGGDAALREQVQKLLRIEQRESEFLETPALGRMFEKVESQRREDAEPEPIPPPAPEMIGQYRILGVLGEGGMGIVYKAQQDYPRRIVALKVVRPPGRPGPPSAVSRQLLRRFRHEAEVLGQLMHPGIAQIYEAGTADTGQGGQPFFAMELVSGPPLMEFAEAHRLDVRDRLALMAGICDALHHAHQRGVIHRDLKPSNILVDESSGGGQPKILDFGVARATDADVQTVTLQTDIGQLIGTVPYMSPEQAAGDPSAIDIRSDVYSLGVILYELLTGRLPYELRGKMIYEAVRVIREDEPSHLTSINRVFRGDIDTILSKALEKEKQRRYQSASELAADIRRYLSDEPIGARPATTLYQIRKFARRNRKLVAAVSAGVGIAFTAMAIATVVSLRQSHVASEARTLADARTVQAQRQTYRATIAAAAASLSQYDALSARRYLESAPQSRRNWEWRYLDAQLDDSAALLEDEAGIAAFLTGDDPDQLTTLSRDGRIDHWDLRSGERRVVARAQIDKLMQAVSAPAAGCFVALTTERQGDGTMLEIFDAASGKVVARTPVNAINRIAVNADASCVTGRGNGVAVLWHPDTGQGVVNLPCAVPHPAIAINDSCQTVLVGGAAVQVFDSAGAETHRPGAPSQTVHSIAITPDGSRILTGDYFGAVSIFEAQGTAPLRTIHAHAGPVYAAAFLDNGTRFVTGGSAGDSTVRLWSTDTGPDGSAQRVLLGCVGGVSQLSANPDGSSLTAIDGKGDLRIWNLGTPGIDPTTVLQGHNLYVYDTVFTPDGARLITGSWDKTVRIWDALTGECLGVLRGEHGYVTSLDISPDGRLIATGHHHGLWSSAEVRLWDARTGALLHDLPHHSGQVTAVAFSPDGTRLATDAFQSGTRVWDVQSHNEIPQLQNRRSGPWQSAWSPDGKALATSYDDGAVIVVDSTTGRELRQWKAHEGSANFVVYSPHGSQIVTASADTLVKLWDTTTGELLRTLQGHRDVVWCAAFSPDGSRLATGSNDNTIRIWDVESGEQLLELRGHNDYVHSLDFSPDGTMLVSGSGDGSVRIWDTKPLHDRWRDKTVMRALRDQMRPIVESLFADQNDWSAVVARLRNDRTLDDHQREAAQQVVLQQALK